RCRSYHACGLGGFLLGLLTGLCGRAAVAATTAAVESVVLRHLDAQLRDLRDTDVAAFETVPAIVNDERMHHERAMMRRGMDRCWLRLRMPGVGGATEAVIWLGMKL